jgi:hypothetical protein
MSANFLPVGLLFHDNPEFVTIPYLSVFEFLELLKPCSSFVLIRFKPG